MATFQKCGHGKSLDEHCEACRKVFRVEDDLRQELARLREENAELKSKIQQQASSHGLYITQTLEPKMFELEEKLETARASLKEKSGQVDVLQKQIDRAKAALRYCSEDDPYAVDPEGHFDVESANEWKKMEARKALKDLEAQ